MDRSEVAPLIAQVRRLTQWRFFKFGVVGASGTLVNLGVLYLAQESLFAAIEPASVRLNASLALAICCATLNNFSWNRVWTWRDRRRRISTPLPVQFGQYALASWVGILVQFTVTNLLAVHIYYLVANVIAIVLASVFDFVANDLWAFGRLKLWLRWRRLRETRSRRPDRHDDRLGADEPSGATTSRWMSALRLSGHAGVAVVAVLSYFYALESQHIPKNGDEYVYEHIARLTAASGHWLPLESDLEGMRNTKPPLLFWQGIVATDWGRDWTLWRLRYPSVIYSLFTALLVFALATKLSGRWETGVVGFACFLGFFSSYHYGRAFLTNPPEVFWLFLPFFAIAYQQRAATSSRVLVPIGLGVAIGIGLLYKSFALAAPAALGLAWCFLHLRGYRLREFVRCDAVKIVLTVGVALALFAGWFALDPDPGAVWREFVLGENLGKFDPHGGTYLGHLFWGPSSIWEFALGYPQNAGLLALPVLALFFLALRDRRRMADGEKLLWIWVIALFLVFCLPSQRSSRYLLAAMPALAVVLALNWERIARPPVAASLVLAGLLLAAFGGAAWQLQRALDAPIYGAAFWALLGLAMAIMFVALAQRHFARPGLIGVVLLVPACFSAMLRPLDGPLGTYDADVQRAVADRVVGVPFDFNAKYERYRFLLPGSVIEGYRADGDGGAKGLAARFRVYAVQLPLDSRECEGCKVIAQRLDLRTRNVTLTPGFDLLSQLVPRLVVREYLVDAGPGSAERPDGAKRY